MYILLEPIYPDPVREKWESEKCIFSSHAALLALSGEYAF